MEAILVDEAIRIVVEEVHDGFRVARRGLVAISKGTGPSEEEGVIVLARILAVAIRIPILAAAKTQRVRIDCSQVVRTGFAGRGAAGCPRNLDPRRDPGVTVVAVPGNRRRVGQGGAGCAHVVEARPAADPVGGPAAVRRPRSLLTTDAGLQEELKLMQEIWNGLKVTLAE